MSANTVNLNQYAEMQTKHYKKAKTPWKATGLQGVFYLNKITLQNSEERYYSKYPLQFFLQTQRRKDIRHPP